VAGAGQRRRERAVRGVGRQGVPGGPAEVVGLLGDDRPRVRAGGTRDQDDHGDRCRRTRRERQFAELDRVIDDRSRPRGRWRSNRQRREARREREVGRSELLRGRLVGQRRGEGGGGTRRHVPGRHDDRVGLVGFGDGRCDELGQRHQGDDRGDREPADGPDVRTSHGVIPSSGAAPGVTGVGPEQLQLRWTERQPPTGPGVARSSPSGRCRPRGP